MKLTRKKVGLGLAGALIALFLLTIGMTSGTLSGLQTEKNQDKITHDNVISLQVKRADGTVEPPIYTKNTVTNIGLNQTLDQMFGLSTQDGQNTAFDLKYLAVESAGAVAATDTSCTDVSIGGTSRGTGSVVWNGTTGCARASYTWTASATHSTIDTGCIYYNATGNTLYAGGAFSSSVNLESGDQLTLNYTICYA